METVARLKETANSVIGYAVVGFLMLSGMYWLWLSIKFGSFLMFVIGLVPLCYPATIPLGAWSLVFGAPHWLENLAR